MHSDGWAKWFNFLEETDEVGFLPSISAGTSGGRGWLRLGKEISGLDPFSMLVFSGASGMSKGIVSGLPRQSGHLSSVVKSVAVSGSISEINQEQ